ncbi:MAG: DUF479 domain-containing protein [Lewinellaceae bacterium]|nr:DUF479 domain-containing protein [Lewinellaceae bacterium]
MRESIRRIRPLAGRFAGPVTDILYDHLLHLHWESATTLDFEPFADWVYDSLDVRLAGMPDAMQRRWPRMREGRFLHGYQERSGLDWVLGRFNQRLGGTYDPEALSDFFFEHLDLFSADFSRFYPDLKLMAASL